MTEPRMPLAVIPLPGDARLAGSLLLALAEWWEKRHGRPLTMDHTEQRDDTEYGRVLLVWDHGSEVPAVDSQGRRVFWAGSPEPGETVKAVRYKDAVTGWTFHRKGIARGGVTEWLGVGPSGDKERLTWDQVCRIGSLVDVTSEVAR